MGGCLTLLASSIGTPYEFEADGCVLMVEDLNTEPYLVDTALNHLLQAGKLDNIAGFVFGTDVNLKDQTIPDEPESTLSIEEMLDELIAPLGIPAIAQRAVRPRQAHGDDAARGAGAPRRRREDAGGDRGSRRGPGRTRRSAVNRWKTLAASAVLVAAVALGLVTSSGSAQDSASGDKDVLRIGWAQDPKNLNPFVGVNEEEYTIWAINWELLINFDPEDLTPTPGIAESWEVSEDNKTITFNLVKGAKWSDGEPITSKDVKFSLEVLGDNGLLFTGYTSSVRSIKTPDDETVVLEMKSPDARAIGGLYIFILPEHIWGKVPVKELTGAYQPEIPMVGSGPYIVTEFTRGRITRMEVNPEWRGEAPGFEELQFIRYGSQDAVERALTLGEIDFIPEVEPATFERLGQPGGDRDHQLAHLRVHRARLQPVLGGGLSGREVQPRRPGQDDPPGGRLRHRPRADQRDRHAGHGLRRPRHAALVLQGLLRGPRAGLPVRPGDGEPDPRRRGLGAERGRHP